MIERPETSKALYLPQLDGLRFFAFLLVFFHHVPPLQSVWAVAKVQKLGWIGVDLFFVISSFLICTLLFKELENHKKINFWSYCVRRVLRIWPLYIFFLVFLFGIIDQGYRREAPEFYWSLMLFVDNLRLAFSGFFNIAFKNNAMHLWTISFEEQIYVFLPMLTVLVYYFEKRTKIRSILYGALLFLAAGVFVKMFFIARGWSPLMLSMIPIFRMEPIMAGLMMALFYKKTPKAMPGKKWLAVGSLMLLGLFFYYPLDQKVGPFLEQGYRAIWFYFYLACAFSFLVYGVCASTNKAARFLSNPVVVYLGKISYGLYIWHYFCINLLVYYRQNIFAGRGGDRGAVALACYRHSFFAADHRRVGLVL